MARLAGKTAAKAACAIDGGDHAQRQPLLLQAGPLLDMQFKVGDDIIQIAGGARNRSGVQPHIRHRLGDGNAVTVRMGGPALRPAAGDAAAAEQRNAEARALFIAEADYLNRQRQALPLLMQPLHGLNRGQHAQHAVIAAGVAHRIEMGAEQQRGRAVARPFVAAADIADFVLPDAHARLLHPLADLGVGAQMLRREVDARQLIGRFADRRQRVAAHHDAFGGQLRLSGVHHHTRLP